MIDFRNFNLTNEENNILSSINIDDIFKYTENIIRKNKFNYLNIDELASLLTKDYYVIIDNNYTVKKNQKIPSGSLYLSNNQQLLKYISETILNDLAENMRFVDINLEGEVFILDDNNELSVFKNDSELQN